MKFWTKTIMFPLRQYQNCVQY